MICQQIIHTYIPFSSPDRIEPARSVQRRSTNEPDDRPPQRPDWLLILVGFLFLLTLLIAHFVGIPRLF